MEVITNFLHFIHLISYSSNGYGLVAFKVISEIISVGTNFILICLLIMISWGWSIEFLHIEDYDLYIPLASMILIV